MEDKHSNVPNNLKNPAKKHKKHQSGNDFTAGDTMLIAANTKKAASRQCWLQKRNFRRNANGKYIVTPANILAVSIPMSAREKERAAAIFCMAQKYIPPANWKQKSINIYIKNLACSGMKSLNDGNNVVLDFIFL
jgi:hypothetical protein